MISTFQACDQSILNFQRRSLLKVGGGLALAASTGLIGQSRAAEAAFEPPRTEFVFEAYVPLDPNLEVGPSAYGTCRAIPIIGGTFAGPRIQGKVLPGGADWQLDRPDGGRTIGALYMLQADDGATSSCTTRACRFRPQKDAKKSRVVKS